MERRMLRFTRWFAVAALIVAGLLAPLASARAANILVFAAATTKNALDDVDAAFTKQSNVKVVATYDASSALIKQIEGDAPADVFLSADLKWMDYASRKKLIKDDTRVNLLGDRLVLIAPKDSKIDSVKIGPGFDLAKLAGHGKVATGDIKAVPVGICAQAVLQKLGAWTAVDPRITMTQNVRAALVLVARGEAPLGIVYSTDAKVEPGVKVLGVFPEEHDPIIYPVAASATTPNPAVTRYLNFLRSSAAKAIFEQYGFSFLISPKS
jgi:molybdate transport system substrate-binding protein